MARKCRQTTKGGLSLKYPDVLLDNFREIAPANTESATVSRAPGRIEILGNHTDYNGGLVLASTIDQFIWTLGVPSSETILRSVENDETVKFDSIEIDNPTEIHWSYYVRGIYWAFQRRKHVTKGITGVIHGNLPMAAGLGSSAALEVSLVNIISHLNKLKIIPKSKAMLAYEAERLFCGISCGVMDQFTSQLGKPDTLLGIHCGNMMTQEVPMQEDISFIVVNSMVDQSTSSIPKERRAECLRALNVLQEANWDIHSLSAISSSDLQSVGETLDDTLLKRVTHVVNENQRVRDGITAMKNNNPQALGKIMIESHESSRDLYEVSHQNLEILMGFAREQKGVLGSRLTGQGLGGNVLLLTKEQAAEDVLSEIAKVYERETGLVPETAICTIPGGVVVEDVSI